MTWKVNQVVENMLNKPPKSRLKTKKRKYTSFMSEDRASIWKICSEEWQCSGACTTIIILIDSPSKILIEAYHVGVPKIGDLQKLLLLNTQFVFKIRTCNVFTTCMQSKPDLWYILYSMCMHCLS